MALLLKYWGSKFGIHSLCEKAKYEAEGMVQRIKYLARKCEDQNLNP